MISTENKEVKNFHTHGLYRPPGTAPIILTSRADSVRTRMASIAVGALYAHHLAEQRGQAGSRA